MRTPLKYFCISQLVVVAFLALFYLISGLTLYTALQQVWGTQGIVYGVITLEILGLIFVALFVTERKIVHDERERLIQLRSYRVSYEVMMLAIAGYFIFCWLTDKTNVSRDPIFWLMLLGIFVPNLAIQLYRRIL